MPPVVLRLMDHNHTRTFRAAGATPPFLVKVTSDTLDTIYGEFTINVTAVFDFLGNGARIGNNLRSLQPSLDSFKAAFTQFQLAIRRYVSILHRENPLADNITSKGIWDLVTIATTEYESAIATASSGFGSQGLARKIQESDPKDQVGMKFVALDTTLSDIRAAIVANMNDIWTALNADKDKNMDMTTKFENVCSFLKIERRPGCVIS